MRSPVLRAGQPYGRILFIPAILLLTVLLRTYHLGYPAWDYFASRQTFNLMVVRSYLQHGISLSRPTVDWLVDTDPARPSFFCAELSWLHAVAALVMRFLAAGDWCARLIPIAFSLAGVWWIYRLTERTIGRAAARFAALAWAVLPFGIFFGRAFMSDLPALSLAVGTLDSFCEWLETGRSRTLAASALLGAMALLTKPQVGPFCLVLLYLAFLKFRGRMLAQGRLYAAAAIIAAPTVLWIRHAARLALAGGPDVIGAAMIGRSMHLWLHVAAWREQWVRLSQPVLGPVALGVVALGLLWPLKDPRQYLFHVWFAANAVFLFLIPEAIIGWNDYYLLLLVPPSAGLIGIALGKVYEHGPARARALAAALVLSSVFAAWPLFQSDRYHYRLGLIVKRLTAPGTLIATSAGGAPDPLYFSGRRGWEAARYDLPRVKELAAAGAKLFALADPDAIRQNRTLVPLLDREFVRLTQDQPADWMIWSLEPADRLPNRSVHATSVATVNFGGQVGSTGITVRELLASPPTFEVTYKWTCLGQINTNLRVMVHITTADGRTVFQQDHWPAAGHLPTSQWHLGDTIQEHNLIVLPPDFKPGTYQLRAGWFDPVTGALLPVGAGVTDRQGLAILANVIVPRVSTTSTVLYP